MWLVLKLVGCAVGEPEPLADGLLPAGAWGARGVADGYGVELTVADDGTGTLDNGCWGGDLPAIEVTAGAVDVSFVYLLRGGAGSGTAVPATLTGVATAEALTATLAMDGYPDEDLVLIYGDDLELFECP